MLRTAYPKDREELKALWALCFDEDPDFLNWFFEKRYIPSYCSVYERDGKIVGCAHSMPLNVRIRGHILPCAIICGVSTHPDYRKQGIGRSVMQHLMHILHEYGVVLAPHRPSRLNTYFSIGHYPVSDSMYIEEASSHPVPEAAEAEPIDIAQAYDPLYVCYSRFMQRYSGVIQRSYGDFVFKCQDYLSCDAKCVIYRNNGIPEGYCIYFETPEDINGEELVANSVQAYQALYSDMRLRASGKSYVLRTANDAPSPNTGAQVSIVPRGVMGLVSVSPLLSVLGLQGCSIEVIDNTVPENVGIYDLSGQKTSKAPQLRIEAGRLSQWAAGYRSINDIISAGEAKLLDGAILPVMEKLAPCPCFIFDEY